MKNIIVLGAGRGQIPLMKLCHKYGYKVISVSPKGPYPGFDIADEACYLDVRDKEAVLKYAVKNHICGIVTDQLDAGVLTAAYVSEKMGLRGITYDVALKFTDKYIMRLAAKEAGINVPESICVNNIEEAEAEINADKILKYPVIMKPVDSSASRGVYKVNNIDELAAKFANSQRYSNTKKVIIEQFINGCEYVVESFTRDYKVTNIVVGHRDYFNIPDTFIPNATVFCDAESATDPIEELIKQINIRLVESYNLPFGITHGEYMYVQETDSVYLVEIAARGGGVFISSDVTPSASGVNVNDLLMQEILDIPEKQEIHIKKGAAAYFCYLIPEGTVTQLNGMEEVEKIRGVRSAFFDNIKLGMNTKSICDKSSRKGPIIVEGSTKQECYDIIEKVRNVLDIKVAVENGIRDILWK